MNLWGVGAALIVAALYLTPASKAMKKGHFYRATFDAPRSALANLAALEAGLKLIAPPDAAVGIDAERGQVHLDFVALRDEQLTDLASPFGVFKARGVRELD